MKLSNSGRVVIVDDKQDEAAPLMELFGKHNIPYLYYTGQQDQLPDECERLGGVRFVFLDIKLGNAMSGQSDKTTASVLISRLKKIISEKNGPYFIIFWTQHTEIVEQVIENCETSKIKPIGHAYLEKAECKDNEGKFDINIISKEINKRLQEVGAFRLYTEWENIVHQSSVAFIKNISDLFSLDKDWSDNTSAMFYKLYKTVVSENETEDKNLQLYHASELLNRSFIDTVSQKTYELFKMPENFQLKNKKLENEVLAKINHSLFFSDVKPKLNDYMPGCVYRINNSNLSQALSCAIFCQDNISSSLVELLAVIITPQCDIAYGKNLKSNFTNFHRVIYGLFYPYSRQPKKRSDAFFDVGPIFFKEKVMCLKLHFGSITNLEETKIGNKFVFCIKNDLLFDLQSKAANHINRLGNSQIELTK